MNEMNMKEFADCPIGKNVLSQISNVYDMIEALRREVKEDSNNSLNRVANSIDKLGEKMEFVQKDLYKHVERENEKIQVVIDAERHCIKKPLPEFLQLFN